MPRSARKCALCFHSVAVVYGAIARRPGRLEWLPLLAEWLIAAVLAYDWLAGEGMTVADIALYAYTHCADEGGFSLDAYPAIRAWLDRVTREPGHVLMDA